MKVEFFLYTYLNQILLSLSLKHLGSQGTKNLEEYSALVVGAALFCLCVNISVI